eukprot:2627233-Prymnesium_polylepis.2
MEVAGDWDTGARCHLSLSSAWHAPHHPCCCNPIARGVPDARREGPGCSRGCRRGGTRASGWQVGASAERCTHRRRDGVVHVAYRGHVT